MDRRFYSKRHFERLSNGGPDTEESIRQRKAWYESGRRGVADREAKFPELTVVNFEEAIAYQTERIKFHYEELLKEPI